MGEPDGASDRFELRGQLGAGSMGTVYRVLDRLRGSEVAMKTLKAFGPNALYRFKREFRELCDLCHPNLIALHELYSVGDEWMFTMELIEGVSFREWVRDDPDQLRPALIQLADGLTALHATGKVHRDVKPSNVMVSPEGRVVILDFGLISDLTQSDATHEGIAIGTPGYMSPEQAADVPVSAATDWYAVGTMLYESLTGRKPFLGSSHTVLLDKQRLDPHPPREIASDVPPDLDALTMRLLTRDPRKRPEGEEVLATLGAAPSAWTRRIAERAKRPDLRESRAAELAVLRQALADSRKKGVMVYLHGPRGAGRTSLIEAFAEEIRGGDGLAFLIRIGAREDVPFRGLDQLVDAVTRYLSNADPEEVAEVLPADLSSLARMFPTMQRLKAARLPEMTGPKLDPRELLQRSFETMFQLLAAIAQRRPLAVFLDDVQSGNRIGISTTMRMLRHPDAPHMMVVATYPDEVADSPEVTAMRRFDGDQRDLPLVIR